MPTEKELLALCLRWLEHPGLVHPFDKAMLVEALKAKLEPEPRREWVGLTEHELELLEVKHAPPVHPDVKDDDWWEFARAIEAKLKEKNT